MTRKIAALALAADEKTEAPEMIYSTCGKNQPNPRHKGEVLS